MEATGEQRVAVGCQAGGWGILVVCDWVEAGMRYGECRPSSSTNTLGTAARDAISWVFARKRGTPSTRPLAPRLWMQADINGATWGRPR